jgi:hypothetical protein
MVLLRDVSQVEAHFDPFGDYVILDAKWVHSLHGMCNRLENYFWHSRWNSYVKLVK